MANYIISFDPGPMKVIQKRMASLEDAIWVKDKKDLSEIKSLHGDEAIFFVYLDHNREEIDEFVLIIRDLMPGAKVLYIVAEGKLQNQKTHQMTPVGGDAYFSAEIDEKFLKQVLDGFQSPVLRNQANKLEGSAQGTVLIKSLKTLEVFKQHPANREIDLIFSQVFGNEKKKVNWQSTGSLASEVTNEELQLGDDMSDKDQELSLDDLGELEIGASGEEENPPELDSGLEMEIEAVGELDLAAPDDLPEDNLQADEGMDLDLDDSFSLDGETEEGADLLADDADGSDSDLSLDDSSEEIGLDDSLSDMNLGSDEDVSLDFTDDPLPDTDLGLGDEELDLASPDLLDLGEEDNLSLGAASDVDLSDDAMEKLKEIDAIMDLDASQVDIHLSHAIEENNELDELSLSDESEDISLGNEDSDLDTPLVSDDLDLGSLNFNAEEEQPQAKEEKVKKKTKEPKENKEVLEAKESKEARPQYDGDLGRDLKEISNAYSGEMERMQATLSNLRTDREELLTKIQKHEEDKLMQSRQSLSLRAELDEKKIELSIIRKKLNDEITDLKDRMKLHDEKRLILEEKNKLLAIELDKSAQRNKIDVKKIQMRERELEQKLELLKADSETQIRHRDLKILELKRKLDSMEFDMESISVQEKRSVESRFELEDKLDKAIKTLRNAISVLEDESEKSNALEALKKNIDM